jgi:glutathione peroxidase-family protein
MSIAIDRNINDKDLFQYLNPHKNIYFKPTYLLYQDGLEDLLKTKNIKFNKIIPLTVVINRNGSVAARFTGVKSENYLNRKIIKSLDNPS